MDEKELNALFDIEEEVEDEVQDGVVDQNGNATDEGADDLVDTELDQEGAADGSATHQQTPEMNHLFSQVRKQAEQQARAAEEESQRARAETALLQDALRQFGYDGTPQEMADAIEAARSQRTVEEVAAERAQREAELDQQIANHPAVIQAREMTQAIIRQRNEEMFAREIANIQRINPEIKSLLDLQNLGADQDYFDFLVKAKGMHIDQAYKEIQRGKVPQIKTEDTRANIQTFNGAAGGKSLPDVPKEVEDLCLQMNPGLSKDEIRKYHSKYMKGAKA